MLYQAIHTDLVVESSRMQGRSPSINSSDKQAFPFMDNIMVPVNWFRRMQFKFDTSMYVCGDDISWGCKSEQFMRLSTHWNCRANWFMRQPVNWNWPDNIITRRMATKFIILDNIFGDGLINRKVFYIPFQHKPWGVGLAMDNWAQ